MAAGALAPVLDAALALQGRPYRFGGSDPRSGFDCSGLVWYVFVMHGITVPRTTVGQYDAGRPVDPDEIAPGDLVFFSIDQPGPSHVGIALDHRTLVHAPSTGSVVRVERFDTPYWRSRLEGVRRIETAATEVRGSAGAPSAGG
jgi:cell wall-associated NlpC family hydrolase